MKTMALLLDGLTDLPPGRIASVVTFLERHDPPPALSPLPAGIAIRRLARPDVAWYRALYRRVGENWLWFSRLSMSDTALAAILHAPGTIILAMERDGEAIGFAEIDDAESGAAEVFGFGLVPEATGSGLAHFLMERTLAHAAEAGAKRVWLHTCTFDHPAAVPFYLASGFTAYKFAVEVSDDPRLTGSLPATAAPHVPLLGSPFLR